MIVLGIESSCDETAAALVDEEGVVLADVVASQIKTHAPYGGVVPELASRSHMRAIAPVIEEAVDVLPNRWEDVDAIAVTQGPGLIGSLLVGAQAAKAIAWSLGKPLVGVDHLQGHLFAAYLKRDEQEANNVTMPFIALLVSGGHTALYRVDSREKIDLLGQTRDDAAGEAFDKVAKLLGLGYPGGPVVDRLAQAGNPKAIALPNPMANKKSLEFSFSGLKTAMVRHVDKHGLPENEESLADVCASFQQVVVSVLVRKSIAACKAEGVDTLVLTGGVAANRGLRAHAAEQCAAQGITLCIPPMASCTDNAAMIAYAGVHRLMAGQSDPLDFEVYSRDPARRRGKF